ncbi:MAG TPA: SEC-C metal-binding domain-containing protein [Dissulfurispiraceae bacterium]
MERNGPCPCGSGKKYKKCCGGAESAGNAKAGNDIKDRQLKPGACNFDCIVECSGSCCGGATMITIDEVAKLYDVFPITVGFRKYSPVDENHEAFLEAVGTGGRGQFIVGDFIAGNWRKGRCAMLGNDNLCRLHKEGRKPIQCSLVPFCAIYPEERQDSVFMEQSKGAFSRCKGFCSPDDSSHMVWKDGKFAAPDYAAAFSAFRSGLLRQKSFMAKMLKELKKQVVFSNFMRGGGILEAAVPADLIPEFLDMAGIPSGRRSDFIGRQTELCGQEVNYVERRIEVYRDCVKAYERAAAESMSSAPAE